MPTTTKPAKAKVIHVEGSGRFPIDMLRYDKCFPRNEQDSAKITGADDTDGDRRHVMLVTYAKEVTPERWASFGWKVVRVEMVVSS